MYESTQRSQTRVKEKRCSIPVMGMVVRIGRERLHQLSRATYRREARIIAQNHSLDARGEGISSDPVSFFSAPGKVQVFPVQNEGAHAGEQAVPGAFFLALRGEALPSAP